MNDKIISGIYCIENTQNNKKYIGQSKNIHDRWQRHIRELKNQRHENDYLQKAWNKYGEAAFRFYVVKECPHERLDIEEDNYIKLYNTMNRNYGYNLKSGGQNGGSVYSVQTREKISNSVKASYSNKLKKQRSQIAKEYWANSANKLRIVGKGNGMFGKHHSEEARAKMSASKKGKTSWRRNTTPVYCIELEKSFIDATTAGKELSIDGSGVLKVCQGKRHTAGGYHWRFLSGK